MSHNKKITLLRNLLKKEDCNYYLLPRTDKFLNEFIQENDERVKWLTGFSGSFAFVIISLKNNAIFTDGRYIDQIKEEVNQKNFKIFNINGKDPISWLKERIKAKERILLDSWLFTSSNFNYIRKAIYKKRCEILLSKEIFIDKLEQKRQETFPESPPDYIDIISDAVFTSLNLISRSDALYHDVEHTCLVTLCGLEIFAGKKILEGELKPEDWLHYTIALLFHDVGYIKNILPGDDETGQMINVYGDKYQIEYGATDASLTPYHVERGKLFIQERQWNNAINKDLLSRLISFTQFPIPERAKDSNNEDSNFNELAELVGSADLIGQLADPMYDIMIPRLYREFEETGSAEKMGYSTPGDLRRGYPSFFINFVKLSSYELLW